MTEYRFEVVVTYSDIITIGADSADRAHDLAVESVSKWIDLGDNKVYPEGIDVYNLDDK